MRDKRGEIKSHMAAISMYFWGWIAGSCGRTPDFVQKFIEWIIQDTKAMDNMIDGRQLKETLLDVQRNNISKGTAGPEQQKKYEDINLGVEYAINAIERLLKCEVNHDASL